MLIDELRDERGNCIVTYYNSYSTYILKVLTDGDDNYNTEFDGQFQHKYLIFNNLIYLHHNILNKINGFSHDSNSYLPSDEGAIGTTEWWAASDATNQQSQLFYSNQDQANAINALYALNSKSDANKRSPYFLWNQYHNILGSFDKRAWKNAPDRNSYTPTQNPLASGANYRLGEPLEVFGNTDSLIWNRIVYNGEFHYRQDRLKNTSFVDCSDSGFLNYFSNGKSIGGLYSPFTQENYWPSPYEIFRYTIFGSGVNTYTGKRTVSVEGQNKLSEDGNNADFWEVGECYLYYNNAMTNWALFKVLEVEVKSQPGGEGGDYYWTEITCYPIINNLFSGSQLNFVKGPDVGENFKQSPQGNVVYDGTWVFVYNNFYNKFKSRIDGIINKVGEIINDLNSIINFNYTIINQESNENIGLNQTVSFKNSLQTWLTQFNQIVNNTGSGATYSLYDNKWSNANLDVLLNKIKELLDFQSNYNGNRVGVVGNWIDNLIPNNILGNYNIGEGEEWNPNLQASGKNNSGNYGSGQLLYYYRYYLANKRVNRNDGVLFQALGAYKTYNQKLTEIQNLEYRMQFLTQDNKYDITPTNIEASTDSEEEIKISWEAVKAATSYDIQFKEGLNGQWQNLVIGYSYFPPSGNPPDFNKNPLPEYTIKAATSGYQEFGLNFTSKESQTGIANDFTMYDFFISVDNSQPIKIYLKGVDIQTWESLRAAIQKKFEDESIGATATILNNDIRITSNSKGINSRILITNGNENNLLSTINANLKTPVNGTKTLDFGKAYYFRVRVNNGHQYIFGNGGINDKDWDSISEWSTSNYKQDRAIHGDVGYLSWSEPKGLKVSGFPVDNDLTPSTDHIKVEWLAEQNANKYRIFRSTIKNGGYTLIAETQNNYYFDTETIFGLTYYYKVQAVSDSNNRVYKQNSDELGDSVASAITPTGVRGVRLWGPINLIASKDNKDYVKLTWNNLQNANGYIVYYSNMKEGQYSYISEDNGKEKIITENFYIHKTPAEQYLKVKFTNINDGLTEFEKNTRYYFVIITTNDNGERSIKEYYITSPNDNVWRYTNIVNSINNAITKGENNILLKIVHFTEPSENYRIKLESKSIGENAIVMIVDGLTGKSLLEVLGDPERPTPGGGVFPGMQMFYRVEGVEIVNNEIVRRSELSNIDYGERPVL